MPLDPSIALGFQMPKFASPMQAASNAMTLKAQMQQSQMRNIEMAQSMQSLKDQQELSRLQAEPGNMDPTTGGLTPEAIAKISNPTVRQKVNQDRLATQYKQKEIDYKSSEAGKMNEERQTKALNQVYESAMSIYDSTLKKTGNQQAATEAFNKAQAEGYDELKTTGRGGFTKDTQFKMLTPADVDARLIGHKERAQIDKEDKTPFIKETEYLKRLEGQLSLLKPTDPAAGVLRKQIGEVKAHIAKLDAPSRTQINMAGGPASLQGDALDMAANQLLIDGKMPAGFARNSANVGAIYKRAAELAKSKGQTAESALFNSKSIKSDQNSLTNITKQSDMITAFESTALKNLDMLVAQSAKVPRTAYPLLNKAILTGKLETGDPEVAKLHAIVRPFVDEYAKILSGQTGAAGASDTARREAAGIIAGYMAPDQINQLAPFIKQELKNRTGSLEEQREVIKARMGSGGKPVAAEKTDAPAKPAAMSDHDKAAVTWAKANPNDPRAKKILEMNGG